MLANDNFASRTVLDMSASLAFEVAFDLNGSTLEAGEQNTAGMAGSIWYEAHTPIDQWVLFEVPAGVEVRIYRGTATLAGMLYQDVSNDANRSGFYMSTAYTYFAKLQSATATESGSMKVRPYGWSDWITPPPVLMSPGFHRTVMNRGVHDTVGAYPPGGFATWSDAWDFALAGPDEPGDYQTIGYIGVNAQAGFAGNPSWQAEVGQAVLASDFAASHQPLSPDGWPTQPSVLDSSAVVNLDWATDPVSGNSIVWDAGSASIVNAMGKISFDGSASSSSFNNGPDARTQDFHANPVVPPPNPSTATASWPTPPSSGVTTPLTIHFDPVGPVRSVTGGTIGLPGDWTDYDVVSVMDDTRVAFSIGPDSSLPDPGSLDSTSSQSFIIASLSLTVLVWAPVQYPRYKIYGPLEVSAAAPGWVVGAPAWV